MRALLSQLMIVAVCTACHVSGAEMFPVDKAQAGKTRVLAPAAARKYETGFVLSADKKEIIVDTVSRSA